MPRRSIWLWRFELRQWGANADASGERDAKAVANDDVSSDERCSRDVSSTLAVSAAVASAALPGRWLNERHRQGMRG
jgi:hypothetical protein